MRAVIVDYGSGNLRSIAKSCERAAKDIPDMDVLVTNNPEAVIKAERIILPGVGAFGDCAEGIKAIAGMQETLEDQVRVKGKPFLGVCVGMQLLADKGLEHGEHNGMGWIPGEVVPIKPGSASYKIPHMGWNTLAIKNTHPILQDINSGDHAYFVHSFHFTCQNKENVLVEVEYGISIAAVVADDNIVGTQFHPEKSQETGIRLLTNFMKWRP